VQLATLAKGHEGRAVGVGGDLGGGVGDGIAGDGLAGIERRVLVGQQIIDPARGIQIRNCRGDIGLGGQEERGDGVEDTKVRFACHRGSLSFGLRNVADATLRCHKCINFPGRQDT